MGANVFRLSCHALGPIDFNSRVDGAIVLPSKARNQVILEKKLEALEADTASKWYQWARNNIKLIVIGLNPGNLVERNERKIMASGNEDTIDWQLWDDAKRDSDLPNLYLATSRLLEHIANQSLIDDSGSVQIGTALILNLGSVVETESKIVLKDENLITPSLLRKAERDLLLNSLVDESKYPLNKVRRVWVAWSKLTGHNAITSKHLKDVVCSLASVVNASAKFVWLTTGPHTPPVDAAHPNGVNSDYFIKPIKKAMQRGEKSQLFCSVDLESKIEILDLEKWA
ncbi:hypothetical protein [Rariglobus hedericola]|uniref:Uncharacterized protein n=1 Tax=Rariglobus hedericola TaxID=2597822 RepID=A0A556QPD4_9BACT|nr:hypothetical protein [Rariglobus hedericola]TSJ78496.1 hypothetical protein FPL22_04130 [Rariglobus hedericola]